MVGLHILAPLWMGRIMDLVSANQLQAKWHVSFRVKHVRTSTRLCRSCARTTGKFADTGVAASQSPRVSESGVEAPASLQYSFATKQTSLVHSL